ncbi:MAG: V-type ATP synthase subunit I [Lachnospiraceae bacterium]
MAVLTMKKINICGLKKNRKAVLEQLQVRGVVEINRGMEEDEVFQKMDTSKARNQFDKSAQVADHALAVLDEYAPEKTGLLSSLAGREPIGVKVIQETVAIRNQILNTAYDLVALNKIILDAKASIVRLETQIIGLEPWLSLDIPMDTPGTKKTAVFVGSFPNEWTENAILEAVAKKAPELEAFELDVLWADKNQTCVAVVCLKQEQAALEDVMRTLGFARPSQVYNDVPKNAVEKMQAEIQHCKEEITSTEQKIVTLSGERENLKRLSDYFRMRAQKYEVLGTLIQSNKTFLITGYIPEKCAEQVRQSLTEQYDILVEIEDVPDQEEAPVILENNAFAASTEGVVESFGLPHKGEIDPTPIMSIFYVVLFGMMLSDAGYGLLMAVGCFIVVKKFPNMEEGMKKMLTMFMYCGVSTLIWGLLFGSFFGDAVTVIGSTFFHVDVAFPALWFTPLNEPMLLLMYSVVIGLVHMFVGLGIKAYMLIRDKQYMEAFVSVGCWMALLIGAILLFVPTDIFSNMLSIEPVVFPAPIVFLSKVLTIGGALGLLLFAGRRKKNPAMRLALGAYELYNVTSWLSDILSYSRLLALCLATGVIASVFNTMASMFGDGIFGVIMFTIVFVIGHIFNVALSLLSAYVHTNRLQFVEFFGKFYEGGGKAFEAFKANTKYYKIKED